MVFRSKDAKEPPQIVLCNIVLEVLDKTLIVTKNWDSLHICLERTVWHTMILSLSYWSPNNWIHLMEQSFSWNVSAKFDVKQDLNVNKSIIKGIVHLKIKMLSSFTPSCLMSFYFFCGTQNLIFLSDFFFFLSLQWKSIVTKMFYYLPTFSFHRRQEVKRYEGE